MLYENEEELWDLYDENRIRTGKTHRRAEPMKTGEYHLVVHIAIFNKKKELLIQQRQPSKKGYPNMWDISVGGSAVQGESSRQAAEREAREELGIALDLSKTRPFMTLNFAYGFDDYYLIEQEIDLTKLKLQPEEVKCVKWATKEEVLRLTEEGVMIPYFFMDQLFDYKQLYDARKKVGTNIQIGYATKQQEASWLNLVEIVKDQFPGLSTKEEWNSYKTTVETCIKEEAAICAMSAKRVVGILLFDREQNQIGCLAVHPEYRRRQIATKMLTMLEEQMDKTRPLIVETYQKKDPLDQGARAFYEQMGFCEVTNHIVNGYPVSQFRREPMRNNNRRNGKERFDEN